MARRERSAGIVVYHVEREGSGGKREYLLLDYGRFWDYPKGHVEQGEDDRAAALRELAEETGITDVRVVEGFRHEIQYFFRDKSGRQEGQGGLIRKNVVFFLGETDVREVKVSDEHVGFAWLGFEAALERLTYPAAKETLRAAEAFLSGGVVT